MEVRKGHAWPLQSLLHTTAICGNSWRIQSRIFFADDLAVVIGGRIGVNYTLQCLDVERKLKQLFDNLEYYTVLAVQPINYNKTVWMWSARAVTLPKFDVYFGGNKVNRVNIFRYLGYHLTSKLGWGNMLSIIKNKVGERLRMIKSCRIEGTSSSNFRKVLFSTFVKPLFTWLCSIVPLLTAKQYDNLGHFYPSYMRKVEWNFAWTDIQFFTYSNVEPFENLCHRYWSKYKKFLSNSDDGRLLYEQSSWNLYRSLWFDKKLIIKNVYRSKRFVSFSSSIEKGLRWLEQSAEDSLPRISQTDLSLLMTFPEFFL